ncbi:DNA polymerase subunit Cdc27-domain-containing protein [Phycomyces nitens]|nr:DNA polymerase subunit Cdc27-domain-containing protein [Phycomyces nitens]
MNEYLDTKLLHEKEPVTYRLLTRQFSIPVNTAKQVLEDYANTHQNVHATWCMIGTEKASDSNQLVIRLVKSNQLESIKQTFKHLSGTHVYCLYPYIPKDLSATIAIDGNLPRMTAEDRIKCGLLQNTRLVEKLSVKQESAPTQLATVNTKSTPSTFGSFLKTPNVSTSAKRKQPTNEALEPRKTNIFSTVKQSSEPKTSDDEDDIFNDDVSETKANNDTSIEPVGSVDEDVVMAENPIDSKPVQDNAKETQQNPKEPTAPLAPGKIRQKVQKKKTYKDERGFRVTQTVWEWEEVDADSVPTTTTTKPSPKPVIQSTTPSKPKADLAGKKGKAVEGQASLFSFFGKK